jgi:hypothetical protein
VRNLPVFLLGKSTFWMWLLYTDSPAGCDISTWFFFFLLYRHICDLGSSPTNIEMRSTVLFHLNVTAETFTESKFLAYSCEKPCGFFFKFCPVGNLQFDTVFHCAVPKHWIACFNSVVWYQNTISNFQVLLYLYNQITKLLLAPESGSSDFQNFGLFSCLL